MVARKRAEKEEGARARQRTLRTFLDQRYEPWAKTHLKSAEFQLARLRSDFEDNLDQSLDTFDMLTVERIRQKWRRSGNQPRSINRDIQRLQSVLAALWNGRCSNAIPSKG